jgi:hypothetical protein
VVISEGTKPKHFARKIFLARPKERCEKICGNMQYMLIGKMDKSNTRLYIPIEPNLLWEEITMEFVLGFVKFLLLLLGYVQIS